MPYNIEFQIAGFTVVLILTIVFFSKKRWSSLPNSIYRILLIVTLIELALDIISVITITERNSIPVLNNICSKAYLLFILAYIYCIVLYTIATCVYENISLLRKRLKIAEVIIATILFIAGCIVILTNQLLYGGEGKFIYSYGIPSDTVYIFSSIAVAFVIIQMLCNVKKIPFLRQISIYSFCIMEGAVALIQMQNKELLIVGFGSAITIMIMYFTLENPDMHLIAKLNEANKRSRELLLNILPASIADKLQITKSTFTQTFDDVTILFLDIVGFASLSNEIGTEKIVKLLNDFFSQIDDLLDSYRIEKIKTIGDSYMAAAGIPEYYEDNCKETIKFAQAILQLLDQFNRKNKSHIQVRIGINNGSVVAGIIGKRKFIYDLWGTNVNLASRMESYGSPDRIHVTRAAYEKLKGNFDFEKLNAMDIKGFGILDTYLLTD